MDSHNVQRYVDATGHARNEGDVQVGPAAPYPIGYRAIVPKAAECTNLLVPVCLSASHIAYGSIRMEPVFMVLGQSAATAAALAHRRRSDVQDVDYAKLQKRLLADGQVLDLPRGRRRGRLARSRLPGVVVDDDQAELTGDWATSTASARSSAPATATTATPTRGRSPPSSAANLPPGRYEVRLAYSANDNRAPAVPVMIHHAGGTASVVLNEQTPAPIDGLFVPLGTFAFEGPAVVEISNEGTSGLRDRGRRPVPQRGEAQIGVRLVAGEAHQSPCRSVHFTSSPR